MSMNLPKLKRYQKKFEFSYSFGAYPTLDLLKFQEGKILKILYKEEGLNSDGVGDILKICKEKNIPFEENSRCIDRISFKENTYVVGIFEKYECKLSEKENHVVLVEPSNMGNLGTVIRSMLGFDFKNLAIISPATDIFDPSVVRSTMGAIFHIDFEYFGSIEEYLKRFPNHNMYPFMLDGATNILDVKFVEPISFIHGNEGRGLNEKFKSIGQSVYIPHSKEIDSLNLSVATSIGLWEFRKRK